MKMNLIATIATLMFASQLFAAPFKPATREMTERAVKSVEANKKDTNRKNYAAVFLKGTAAGGLVKNIEKGLAVGSLKFETVMLQTAEAKNTTAAGKMAEYSATIKTEADADAVADIIRASQDPKSNEFVADATSRIEKGVSPETAFLEAAKLEAPKESANKPKMSLEDWLKLFKECFG